MKKNIWLLMMFIIVSACGGGGDGGDTPEVNRDYLSVTPNIELLGDGETKEFTISSNCNWTLSKDVDWLTVSPMSGSNTRNVTISATKNPDRQNRTAVISIQGGSLPVRMVTVTQLKATGVMSVNKESIQFDKKGGTQTFIISSNVSWSISCPEWCSLSVSSGSGNATISVSVNENPITEQRSGQILIKGDGVDAIIINVSQDSGDAHQPGSDDNLPPS